jgi:transcriptional regulator with XRE-family HTH domain
MEAKMKTLNPKALKQLRKKRGWSHAELERRAKIGKRRLIELEKETAESHEMRDGKFADLCRALSATPAQLRGEEPITDPMPANYVTLRSKITTVAQMNYDLMAARYGVESDDLVQLAPLMFSILIEDSFTWRRQQMELRKQVLELEEKLRETVYANDIRGGHSFSTSDIISHEELGISNRDPFTEPLEAVNAQLRWDEVTGTETFDNFEELKGHRTTDRFTDFISEKLKLIPHAVRADIADINVFVERNIFDQELRYVTEPELFDYITEGENERATAWTRLALLTGAARLHGGELEKFHTRSELKKWLAEKIHDPNLLSRLHEVAPTIMRKRLGDSDENWILSLDDFGFPEPLSKFSPKHSFSASFTDNPNTSDEGGNENVSA